MRQLEGMKCRAPHGSSWGGIGYHNAMICSVYQNDSTEIKNMQDIKVRKELDRKSQLRLS